MLNRKQLVQLLILNKKVKQCKACTLSSFHNAGGGVAIPSWTPLSTGCIFAEAPGEDEAIKGKPLVGYSGKILWNELAKHNLNRRNMLVINSVNCRPVNNVGGNGKPTIDHISSCSKWNAQYFSIIKPKYVLALGYFALKSLLAKDITSVGAYVGKQIQVTYFGAPIVVVGCYHPAGLRGDKVRIAFFEKAVKLFCSLLGESTV